jgi:DNA helicase II / ATP-dependent DNA helicase PcrA
MGNFLDSLNSQQREAVETIEQPLLIIAGAGSGKTLTVASKIAHLIEKGVGPENILALAYNQKAAEELKERVISILSNSEDLSISTFHSFCNQVIQDNLLSTKLNANFRVITETAQLVYFTKNINSFGIEFLEFNHEPYTLAEEVKKFISRCKDEAITVGDLEQWITQQQGKQLDEEEQASLNNLKDILKIYRSYEDYKAKHNMLDFGDMLCSVHNLLKNSPLILKRYQDRYQYVIVDEFQDTNYIQLQIVHSIAKKHGHITVVGDDDQSIYRFRGAYLTNIAEFKKMFPNFVEKALEHNYRSTKKIVSVANKLIVNSPERTIKELFTNNPDGEKVTVIETPTDNSQANYVLETIKEQLKTHPHKDIAVLCRRRASAEPIIKALRKQSIKFNFVGETGFFQEPIIKDITAYLKVISNPAESNAELVRILHRYNIDPVEISKFNGYTYRKDMCLYEVFDHLNEIKVDKPKFLAAKKVLAETINNKKRMRTLDLIHNLLFELEFYKYEIALNDTRNIQLLNQFYAFAEEFDSLYPDSDLDDFTDYLSYASNFEVEESNVDDQAIVISTIHGVKGMQYPVVIIPDVAARKLPTDFRKDKFPIPQELLKGIQSRFDEKELHIQEERRLFYVAITRAKEKLFMTYAKRYGENKTDSKPSKFLDEIAYKQNPDVDFQLADPREIAAECMTEENQTETALIKQVIFSLRAEKFNEAIENVLLVAKCQNKNLDVKKEIISLIKEPDYSVLAQVCQPKAIPIPDDYLFSVSQFISYKKCPRLYQYRYLMKIPEKPRYYFGFGASVHNIVEQLTRMSKEGKPINQDIANTLLQKYWDPKGYETKIDEKRDYAEAEAILRVFLDEHAKSKSEIVDIERWFKTTIGNVQINGRIDRIDKEGSEFTVIDYKTSKETTSLNELKKDMQLLVYAFAVNEMYGTKPLVGDWFLRFNEKVFFKPEDQAIDALKTELTDIAGKIRAGQFEPKESWECNHCDYTCLCDR